jgi:hypothetical protein
MIIGMIKRIRQTIGGQGEQGSRTHLNAAAATPGDGRPVALASLDPVAAATVRPLGSANARRPSPLDDPAGARG